MILIDTIYTNNSGGRVLLEELVKALEAEDVPVYYLFDSRCHPDFNFIPSYRRIYLQASERKRRLFYTSNGNCFDLIICVSNVPPPIRTKAVVYTFFQNVLLLNPIPQHSLKLQVLLRVKREYIKNKIHNTDFLIVQSGFVRDEAVKALPLPKEKIKVWPFFEELPKRDGNSARLKNHFLFVSDGNAQKNHLHLLEAWKEVQSTHPDAVLHLTVSDNYSALKKHIEVLKTKNKLQVINHGRVNKQEMEKLYLQTPCIIYPSLAESFGLGLIEGIQYGCEVIAADLGYVHAVCKPFATFNPTDTHSIAKAVTHYIQQAPENQQTQLIITNQINQWLQLVKNVAQPFPAGKAVA